MEALCTTIRTHLTPVHGVSSLRLQNHLYGCYILLEDIVQKNVERVGTVITRQNVSFDVVKQFSEIGLRYGFAMDTQLLLAPCPADYQEAWIQVFTTLATLEEVDALEQKVSEIIEQVVPKEDGFFANAAETGSLSPQWVDRALNLLLPVTPVIEKEDPVPSTIPVKVIPASVLEKHKDNPKRLFASTRRKRNIVPPKKLLAMTRRKPNV